MNAKQELFVTEYCKDMNATQAAIRAGYSQRTAYSQGQRMLKNVELKKLVDKTLETIRLANIAEVSEIEMYLTAVMRGQTLSEQVTTIGTGRGCTEAIKVEAKPTHSNRLKAAELLGKRYGMFTDKVSHASAAPVIIIDDIAMIED